MIATALSFLNAVRHLNIEISSTIAKRKVSLLGAALLSIGSLILSATAFAKDANSRASAESSVSAPQNIIMVVADGMGPAYVSAYRFFNDDPATESVETTIFDDILLGTARTHPHQQSGYVTDSAASATALAAGVKTYNGAIGMTVDKKPLETVLHRARKYGMKTGLAVTSTIVHATPASYMVANELRRNYEQIADSFFDDRINGQFLADVMLGAGRAHFIRDDRNIVEEFIEEGFQYVFDYSQLSSVDPAKPLIGLFGETMLPWSLDDVEPNRLSVMTEAALDHLNNDDGFFLLVEASQVDWAGHGNEIASAMAEMEDLVATLKIIESFVNTNPNTLVVITADHSTGGLTVAGADGYRWDPSFIKSVSASVPSIAQGMMNSEDRASYVSEKLGFELNEAEASMVETVVKEMSKRDIEQVIKDIVDARTNTGWTTNGHTAVDVNVYGYGPGADTFKGNLDNTEIAKGLFELLDARAQR
ncbi:alkaline phosphatase [Ningiella sp. W23]|uniref:alkaline phosphatase n=1 Tax=Ningiella sp. W23 TaxID=3023715 RepID=UPI00375674B4